VADFNNDGLLDVLEANEQREDDRVAPGRLLYNTGRRVFRPDPSFGEYVNVAMYGKDQGGRGAHAGSLIIQRGPCEEEKGPQQADFCRGHRSLSWVIYQFVSRAMGAVYDSIDPIDGDPLPARNIQAEALNGDGVMDFRVLAGSIKIYYSSPGRRTLPPNGGPFEEIPAPGEGLELGAAVLQDFDLDGRADIFALYRIDTHPQSYTVAIFSVPPGAAAPSFYTRLRRDPVPSLAADVHRNTKIKDIAAVDYDNDGFADIVFVLLERPRLFHLTNAHPQSGCPRPAFLAVVLEGDPAKQVNRYGIGSSLALAVDDGRTARSPVRTVSSYSHGLTNRGGARDHRIVFGLGDGDAPVRLSITWPNGRVVQVSQEVILGNMNSMQAPLTIKY